MKSAYGDKLASHGIDWSLCEAKGLTRSDCPVEVFVREKELVERIFSVFISPSLCNSLPIGITIPFRPMSIIWTSPIYDPILQENFSHYLKMRESADFKKSIILTVYAHILSKYYKQKMPTLVTKTLLKSTDSEGLPNYWIFNFVLDFSEIIAINPPKMTEEFSAKLVRSMHDVSAMMKLLPPHHFSFYGFNWTYAIKANAEEITSQIQSELVKFGSLIENQRISRLETLFQHLYRSKKIIVALFFYWGDELLAITSSGRFKNECIIMDSTHFPKDSIAGTEIDRALQSKSILNIANIQDSTLHPGKFMDGVRSFGISVSSVIPVYEGDQKLGFVMVGSPDVVDINLRNSLVLNDMIPWFAGAMKQTLAGRLHQVEEIIKTEFTSVHPTLEWRMKEVAREIILSRESDIFAKTNEIEFRDVYPLFGSSDIRSSSKLRNAAIRSDLQTQLSVARNILHKSLELQKFPMVELILAKVMDFESKLNSMIIAGDEIDITHFFELELHPLFNSLEKISDSMKDLIHSYWAELDPEHKTIFRERWKFENSVVQVNKAMSYYVDEMQKKAQNIYPHYFDKHITDGLDHNIYIGSSLVENSSPFESFFLKNIRLWQIQLMCGLAAVTKSIYHKLAIPLETAHLLVVQQNPIHIFFDTEEKQLAVRGAYNIRYEIMKKRIDKVHIRNTKERLTQPNKLAVVFSHESERREYLSYFQYYFQSGLLLNQIEEFELEDLQGIEGLRAIRADINIASAQLEQDLIQKIHDELFKKKLAA